MKIPTSWSCWNQFLSHILSSSLSFRRIYYSLNYIPMLQVSFTKLSRGLNYLFHSYNRGFASFPPPFSKVMAANRGEISVRISRAANELGCDTVGIYSREDRLTTHRYKADEAYLVGKGKSPVGAYLDIASIIQTAKKANVTAIHPGYGFLSENTDFAQACKDAGITFVGPTVDQLKTFGDKTLARNLAIEVW